MPEIGSAFAAMTGKDRMAAISKSLEENDDSLVSGALDISRFLTNLTKVEQDHVREQWRRKRMPAECARIEMLEKGLVHLERAGKILICWELRCADPAIVAAAKQSQQLATDGTAAAGATCWAARCSLCCSPSGSVSAFFSWRGGLWESCNLCGPRRGVTRLC
jgi:hypothetical protein